MNKFIAPAMLGLALSLSACGGTEEPAAEDTSLATDAVPMDTATPMATDTGMTGSTETPTDGTSTTTGAGDTTSNAGAGATTGAMGGSTATPEAGGAAGAGGTPGQ